MSEQVGELHNHVECSVKCLRSSVRCEVGDLIALDCHGINHIVHKEQLKLLLPTDDVYKLKIIDVKEVTANDIKLVVTSYVPGEHLFEEVVVTDGTNQLALGKFSLKISSVINQGEIVENPFGPWGPVLVYLPLWFVLIAVSFLLLIGGLTGFRIRRQRQRKKLREELAKHQTPLKPLHQFYKDLRYLNRTKGAMTAATTAEYVTMLEQILHMYLIRELVVPALDSSMRTLLREIKYASVAVYKKLGREIKDVLIELDKAKVTTMPVSLQDCKQLEQLCRQLVESIAREVGRGQ